MPRSVSLSAAQVKAAARRFRAFSDPIRLRIVLALQGGPLIVKDIVKAVRAPQPTVSKNLGLLRNAGIVTSSREGTRVRYGLAAGWAIGVIQSTAKPADSKAPARKAAKKARKSARRR